MYKLWLLLLLLRFIIPPSPPPKKKGGGGAAHLNLRDRNAFSWAKPRLWSCIHTWCVECCDSGAVTNECSLLLCYSWALRAMQCSPLRTSTRCLMTSANVESRGGQSSNWPARRLSPTTSETDLNWSKNLVLLKTFTGQMEAFPTNYDNPLVIENGDERPNSFMSHSRWQGLQEMGTLGWTWRSRRLGSSWGVRTWRWLTWTKGVTFLRVDISRVLE